MIQEKTVEIETSRRMVDSELIKAHHEKRLFEEKRERLDVYKQEFEKEIKIERREVELKLSEIMDKVKSCF